jgi:UPF0755 protein
LVGLLCLLSVGLTTYLSRQLRISDQDAISSEIAVEIILYQKTDLNDLSQILLDQGVIDSPDNLRWAGKMLGWKTFRKGRYVVEGGYSVDVFLSKLSRGIQDPVDVTILPGIDRERFAEQLSEPLHFSEKEVLELFEDSTFLSEKGLSAEQLLGRMLPETYLIYWTASPGDVVNRILKEFDNLVVRKYQDDIPSPRYSLDDLVALASIIEWEAYNDDEKARISGLYWNRLKRRMRLQADPTVNFAVGERRRLLFEDYEIDHPFNTYKVYGLPPAAITNPSLSSIDAAFNPEEHNFLYMVASPEGGHVFTSNFEAHQRESEKWRQWLREQYRIKRQKEKDAGASS